MKRRLAEVLLLCSTVILLMGADSKQARFQHLGGKIMCSCGCAQMLLQCNHVGCPNSDRMIRELHALTGTAGARGTADPREVATLGEVNDDEKVLQWFRQTWGVSAVVEPATHGFELWAWIMPYAALGILLVMGAAIIAFWRFRHVPVPPPSDARTASLRARVRQETDV